MTYTSQPRTLSSILICVSPSLNFETSVFPKGIPIWSAISCANARFEFNVNNCKGRVDSFLQSDDINKASINCFDFYSLICVHSLLYFLALLYRLLGFLLVHL